MKAAMLKSSQFIGQTQRDASTSASTPKTLRRSQSSGSLGSTSPSKNTSSHVSRPSVDIVPLDRPNRTRKKSIVDGKPPSGKEDKKSKDTKGSMRNFTPAIMVELLAESSTTLDIEIVKKLRLLLRNETAKCVTSYIGSNVTDMIFFQLDPTIP
jgi:hypothetical protein